MLQNVVTKRFILTFMFVKSTNHVLKNIHTDVSNVKETCIPLINVSALESRLKNFLEKTFQQCFHTFRLCSI